MASALRNTKKTISAHNTELDSRMGGGLPVGSLTMIEGGSGSGKSVLSQQIMWGALQDGFVVSLFSSENGVKSLIPQMKSIDLDIFDFLLMGKFKIYPMELSHLGEKAVETLVQSMQKEGTMGRNMIVVDSFTSAIIHTSNQQSILSFFEECKRLCTKGITVLVTMHAETMDGDMIGSIRSMCDGHVVLRSAQDGQKLVKTLEVAKIRGASSVTGSIFGFDVEPGWGMRVIPISKARG